ncbi:MAG: PAS domain S-box protein [Candidatus Jettenia caeni]|nr:PAS domain S-box protein [Candidatus Jettenia caeni]
MTPQFHLRWASLFRSFSRSSGIIAFMVSLSVLVGWIFDIAALKSFNLDPATTMKANTAISFTLVSVSLWLIQMKRANQWTSRIALGCACTVSLIGLLTLIEYSTGWDIGIDQLVFQDHGIAFGISSPGRMSPIAALNFFLIGIALVFLNTKNQKHYRFVQVLIFIIISISFPILIGYFYSIKPLYRIAFYIGIAVHTAILFFILCIGILSLYPNRGLMALLTSVSDGGRLARRLLSATVLILPFLGLLRLLGERQEVYNTEFGLSIQVVFSVVIFVFLIWRSAIALERKGIEYKQTEEQLYEATQRLKFHMENSPLAVVEWNSDYRITRWNDKAEVIFGWNSKEVLGKRIDELRWVYEEDWDKVQQVMADMLDVSRPSDINKNRNYRKDGSVIYCEWYNSALLDASGKLVSVLSLVLDVTERKQMEKKFQESHRTLEALMECIPEGITIADAPDVHTRMISKYGIQLTGRSQKELKGIPAEIHVQQWDILHPDGITPATSEELPLTRATQKGEVIMDEEWIIRQPDGKKITVLCNAGPIKDENGTITGGIIAWRDITGRKQMEEEIRSIAKFPLENPYPVLRIAQNGTLLYANPTSQLLLDEWNCDIGQNIPDFLYRFIRDAFDSRKIRKGIEIEYKDKVFSFTIVPVMNTNYVNLYGADITEQKQTENKLKKHEKQLEELVKIRTAELEVSNEQLHQKIEERKQAEDILEKERHFLKTILDTIEVGIVACNSHGILTLFNRATQELHGLPVEPLPAEQWADHYDLYLPDGVTKMEKDQIPLFRALQGETVRDAELMIIPKRGAVRLMLSSGQPLIDRYGKKFGAVVVMHDITERKRAEEALRASENKYRLLVENLPQRIFYKDKNLSYVSCNEVAARDLQIRPEDISEKTDYDLFPKELADKYRADDKRIMESGKREDIDEIFITHGKELVLHTVKTPIKDEKGNTIGILGCSLDITEKITLQKEAEQSRHLASLGELAAGVGHEINNPITGVINCAQMLFNKSQEGSRERNLASRIIKEGDRIARIVHSLLSFAQPGGREKKGIISIHEILSDTLILTGAQLRKEGIRLKMDIPQTLPKIIANAQLIQQVFLNAINNARYALNQKYPDTHDDKILEISGEEAVFNNGPSIKITFYDHGTGIPAHIRNKVMNPFFTTKPAGKGTGLGLSISHGIIRDHDGKLIIDSVEGRFTKISVILPVKPYARPTTV